MADPTWPVRSMAIGLAVGTWLLQQQAALPSRSVIAVAAAVGLALGAIALRALLRAPRPIPAAVAAGVAAAALGFSWAAGAAHLRLAASLDPLLEGRDVTVTGVIASLPQPVDRGVRFEFDVESPTAGVPGRVLVA